MSVNYIPPSQKLFRSRHKVSRRALQQLSNSETDWSTVSDLPLDSESQLISYAVPVVDNLNTVGCQEGQYSNRSTMCSEHSFLSTSTDTSSIFEMDLKRKMQGNLSLESLLQENKKKILKRQDSINLFESIGQHEEAQRLKNITEKEVMKLKSENKDLMVREKQLAAKWEWVRHQGEDLVLAVIRNKLYWYGLPGDMRHKLYSNCLYAYNIENINNKALYQNLTRCMQNNKFAAQIYANLSRKLPWFNSNSPCNFSAVLDTRLKQKFSGLYHHLKETLKIPLFEGFFKPLVINSISNALKQHFEDEISLELIDILVFSMWTKELESIILDEFLYAVLKQTYHKFFSDEIQDFRTQLKDVKIDLVQILESVRQKHK